MVAEKVRSRGLIDGGKYGDDDGERIESGWGARKGMISMDGHLCRNSLMDGGGTDGNTGTEQGTDSYGLRTIFVNGKG